MMEVGKEKGIMKCYFCSVFMGAVSFLTVAAAAEGDGFVTDLSRGWRFSAGPQFNFGAKGRLGVKSGSVSVPPPAHSSNRAAAQAAGDAISVGSGRTDFPNGAHIDSNDAAGIAGETWNWRVPSGQVNDGVMSFQHAYSEQTTTYDVLRGGTDTDDAWSAGANFGLDRAVWKWGDFGIDVGFNFSFFIKDKWFKGLSGGYTRTDTYTAGTYDTDVDLGNAGIFGDPWSRNPDGSFGAGSFDGPGPVLDLDDISVSHGWGAERTSSSRISHGPFSIRGDLQVYEFQLSLKPYYELTDWFMVRGTLGVGLDHRRLDVRVSGQGGDSERDWDCYMITGLGGMFRWNDVCLGADFLRKVFDDGMDVDTHYVHGSVDNAKWVLRLYIGYEF